MTYDFDASPGRTPDGAEGFRAPSPLDSSVKTLADMIAAAASQGEHIDSATITEQSRAFVEGFVVVLARTVREQADHFHRAAHASSQFGGLGFEEATSRATALEDVATSFENSLSPETIETIRED